VMSRSCANCQLRSLNQLRIPAVCGRFGEDQSKPAPTSAIRAKAFPSRGIDGNATHRLTPNGLILDASADHTNKRLVGFSDTFNILIP